MTHRKTDLIATEADGLLAVHPIVGVRAQVPRRGPRGVPTGGRRRRAGIGRNIAAGLRPGRCRPLQPHHPEGVKRWALPTVMTGGEVPLDSAGEDTKRFINALKLDACCLGPRRICLAGRECDLSQACSQKNHPHPAGGGGEGCYSGGGPLVHDGRLEVLPAPSSKLSTMHSRPLP